MVIVTSHRNHSSVLKKDQSFAPVEVNVKMQSDTSGNAGANLSFFRLRNPFVQILLSSACLFCNPGLYLAVTLLGAGGGRPSSIDMANIR